MFSTVFFVNTPRNYFSISLLPSAIGSWYQWFKRNIPAVDRSIYFSSWSRSFKTFFQPDNNLQYVMTNSWDGFNWFSRSFIILLLNETNVLSHMENLDNKPLDSGQKLNILSKFSSHLSSRKALAIPGILICFNCWRKLFAILRKIDSFTHGFG